MTAAFYLENEGSVATDAPECSEEPASPTDIIKAQEMLDERLGIIDRPLQEMAGPRVI